MENNPGANASLQKPIMRDSKIRDDHKYWRITKAVIAIAVLAAAIYFFFNPEKIMDAANSVFDRLMR